MAFNERSGWTMRLFRDGAGREKRPIDSLTSNIGHCLWSGIVDDEKARGPSTAAAAQRCSPVGGFAPSPPRWRVQPGELSQRFGVAARQCDSAAGLTRYGFHKEAEAVTVGLFAAAQDFGGRLPELICGFDRRPFRFQFRTPRRVRLRRGHPLRPSGCSGPRCWAWNRAFPMALSRVCRRSLRRSAASRSKTFFWPTPVFRSKPPVPRPR